MSKCEVKTCNNVATFVIPKQPKFEGTKFCDDHAKAAYKILKALGNPNFKEALNHRKER
jgi:hypothetical protein